MDPLTEKNMAAARAIAEDPRYSQADRDWASKLLTEMGKREFLIASALASSPELAREYERAQKAVESDARLTDGHRRLLAVASAPPPERTGLFTPDQARQRLAEMDAAKIAKSAEDAFPTAPPPRPGGPKWLEDSRDELAPTTFKNRTPYLPGTWDRR